MLNVHLFRYIDFDFPFIFKKKCGLKIKKNKEVVQCVATWHNVNNDVKNDVHIA